MKFRSVFAIAAVLETAAFALSQTAIPAFRDDLSSKDKKRVVQITRPTTDFSKAEKFESRQGGAGTSYKKVNRNAFSNPTQNLTFEQQQDFALGNALFRKIWVSSPSSTHASDGLGPLFNARSCQTCHLKDGRGHPPEGDRDATSMLIRLAKPAKSDAEIKALRDFRNCSPVVCRIPVCFEGCD